MGVPVNDGLPPPARVIPPRARDCGRLGALAAGTCGTCACRADPSQLACTALSALSSVCATAVCASSRAQVPGELALSRSLPALGFAPTGRDHGDGSGNGKTVRDRVAYRMLYTYEPSRQPDTTIDIDKSRENGVE